MLDNFYQDGVSVPLSQVNLIIGKSNTNKSKFIQRIEGHLFKENVEKVLFYDNPWTNFHWEHVDKIVRNLFEVCKVQQAQAFIVSNSYDVLSSFLKHGSTSEISARLLRFGRSVRDDQLGKFIFSSYQNEDFSDILRTGIGTYR